MAYPAGRLVRPGPIFGVLALASCQAGGAPEPLDLIMMRADGPTVFGVADLNRHPRLFSVGATEANMAVGDCMRDDWVQTGERAQPGFTTGSGRTLDFACSIDNVIILAEVLIDPQMGMDGVTFAACRPESCPPPATAFQHGYKSNGAP